MNNTRTSSPAERIAARGVRRLVPLAVVSILGIGGAVGVGWIVSNDAVAQVPPPGGERPSGDRSSGDPRSSGGSRSSGSSSSGGSSRFSGFSRSSRSSDAQRTPGSERSSSEQRPSVERPSSERSGSERSSGGPSSFERSASERSSSPGSAAPAALPAAIATPSAARTDPGATAYVIPPSKPIPPEYEALLNRSMFIRGRQTTVQRPREVIEQPRTPTVEVSQPVYRPEQHLLLTGVVEERDADTGEVVGRVAQVENTQTFTRERLTVDGAVGRGRIVDITVAGVVFENDGKVTTVPPGFYFDGRMAAAPGSSSVIPIPAPAPVASPPALVAAPAEGAAPATQPAVASAEGTPAAAAPAEGTPAASPTTAPAAAPTAVAAPATALDPVAEMMRRRRLEQGGN